VYLPVREDVSPGNKIKGLFNPGWPDEFCEKNAQHVAQPIFVII
jgi:hypothetical protein